MNFQDHILYTINYKLKCKQRIITYDLFDLDKRIYFMDNLDYFKQYFLDRGFTFTFIQSNNIFSGINDYHTLNFIKI